MRTPARVLGHAIHPMLIVFPLGLFMTAVIFDLVFAVGGNETFSQVGFWNITAGIIGAVLAAATGAVDWISIPRATRAKSIGLTHGALNATALVLFVASWLVRLDRPGHTASTAMFVLEILAVAISGVAGWLGGELIERLGISVDENAEPNAPSSLKRT